MYHAPKSKPQRKLERNNLNLDEFSSFFVVTIPSLSCFSSSRILVLNIFNDFIVIKVKKEAL